jgi:hypothetical protein
LTFGKSEYIIADVAAVSWRPIVKLVMTMLVRNESDIIKYNIEFHAAMGVDSFVIMDHGSSDDTCDIISDLQKIYNIELRHQRSTGYYQAEWVTQMARDAANLYEADWVINNDADEFWWPIEGDLKSTLSSIPHSVDGLYIKRYNFPPMLDGGEKSFIERMKYIDLFSVNSMGNPLPPKLCHRGAFDVEVSQGNHDAKGSLIKERCHCELIEILHYPMRSLYQFTEKIRTGGRAYELSPDIPARLGGTWRQLYQIYTKGELASYYKSQCIDVMNEKMLEAFSSRWKEDTRLLQFIRNLL